MGFSRGGQATQPQPDCLIDPVASDAHRAIAASAAAKQGRSAYRIATPKRHNYSKPVAPLDIPVAPVAIENPVTAVQEDLKKAMMDNSLSKGFDLSSATANVRAYQAKLLEMAQAT